MVPVMVMILRIELVVIFDSFAIALQITVYALITFLLQRFFSILFKLATKVAFQE
jgi:hypothetical protein